MSTPRLSARDYKRSRRGGARVDVTRLRDFGFGLAAGLCVAGVIYVTDHRAPDTNAPSQRPAPRKASADAGNGIDSATGGAAPGSPSTGQTNYDFYTMLPKFEVVVPEKERGTRVAPAAQIDRPGVYFLQVGSYRDVSVAERVRAQLAKLGIEATVQRVAVDNDVWHRVRVGPIRDLAVLNRERKQLQASELDSLVIRVDQ